MSDPIDISKLPTFMLREIVAGETKPQPEEVMPGDTTRPDNAAPQGFNPPAGAAGWRPIQTAPNNARIEIQWPDGATAFVRWDDGTWRDDDGCRYTARDDLSWRTPPPQPPGGTPEVDAEWDRLKAAHLPEHFSQQRAPHWYRVAANLKEFADSLEHHRNEARAALAAAQVSASSWQSTAESLRAEVESLRKERNNALAILKGAEYERLDELKGGTPREWRKIGEMAKNITIAFKDARDEARAELEQTRRVRDSLGVGYDEMHDELYSALGMHLTCAAEIDALRQALTVAEQELSECRNRCDEFGDGENISKPVPDCISDGMGKLRSLLNKAEKALTEQRAEGAEKERDTAIRERDEAKRHMDLARVEAGCPDDETLVMHCREARKDTARLDLMLEIIRERGTDGLIELPWKLVDDDPDKGANDMEEDAPERLTPVLDRAAIDAALAAKTTEGGV